MKGLMIKDLRILLAQKFSLLIYLGVSLFMPPYLLLAIK